jgi:hypothetical protein
MDYSDLDAQITRREEKMCSDVLVSGTLLIEDADDLQKLMEISYGPINRVEIPPAEYWDTPNSDPLLHLELIRRHVTSSGYPASLFVLGRDCATAFLRNQNVRESSNFLNYKRGTIDARVYTDYQNWGVNPIGEFMGMSIVSYDAEFENSYDGKMHHFWPADQILVASTAEQHRFAYGRITQVEENRQVADYQMARVPQYLADPETDNVLFRLSSRPLPIPKNTMSWAVAKTVTLRSAPIDVPVTETVQGRA